jgi:CrcB protein
MWLSFLAVGVGGALGAMLRYSLTLLSARLIPGFPYGTLISNVLAGFFCGAVVYINRNSLKLDPYAALLLTTGVMGGLSTFSTFSVETIDFFREERYVMGSMNILSNLILSLSSVAAGMQAAKKFLLQ